MDDDAPLRQDHKPLTGVVLCCTALPQDVRTSVADIAQELGAKHQLDLISETTHLIVANVMTPKYQYVAKERPDIVVLQAEFIQAVRDAWTSGEDVDVPALEQKYKLPTFFGLRICLTGFVSPEERNDISTAVTEAGAQYDADLTKSVTHLIAFKPEGSKYTHAKQWGLKVVSLRWMTDSLLRGMALDESLYDPVIPVEEQGKGAWRTERETKSISNLGKRQRDSLAKNPLTEEAGRRKLRRTASTRLTSHSQHLFDDISGHESVAEVTTKDSWADTSGSHTNETTLPPEPKPRPAEIPEATHAAFDTDPNLILSGCHVLVSGFDDKQRKAILSHLEPNGATVVTSSDELAQASESPRYRARYVLVPHAQPNDAVDLPEAPPDTNIVSEWWLERCVQRRRVYDSSQDVLSQPLWDPLIDGFKGLSISSSGFDGLDVRQLAQAINMTGATYNERVGNSLSVLISGSNNLKKEKALYASKYKIPVVTADWIWKCLETRSKVPLDDYLIRLPSYDASQVSGSDASTSTPLPTEPLPRKSVDVFKTKESSAKTRLSNTRTRNTPALSMQPSKLSMSHTASKPSTPFIYEDDDDDEPPPPPAEDDDVILQEAHEVPQKRSQPLEERSVNASPRKDSNTSTKAETLKPDEAAVVTEITPVIETPSSAADDSARRAQELNEQLQALSRLRNAPTSQDPARIPHPSKRKTKTLGRNLSGSFGMHRTVSTGSDRARDASQGAILEAEEYPDPRSQTLPSSTQIGYENPDAEQHRRTLEKSMKVNLKDTSMGTRHPSVGTVKDSEFDYGLHTNTTRSHRAQKRGR